MFDAFGYRFEVANEANRRETAQHVPGGIKLHQRNPWRAEADNDDDCWPALTERDDCQ